MFHAPLLDGWESPPRLRWQASRFGNKGALVGEKYRTTAVLLTILDAVLLPSVPCRTKFAQSKEAEGIILESIGSVPAGVFSYVNLYPLG
jgi:hypothetical protein